MGPGWKMNIMLYFLHFGQQGAPHQLFRTLIHDPAESQLSLLFLFLGYFINVKKAYVPKFTRITNNTVLYYGEILTLLNSPGITDFVDFNARIRLPP